MDLRTGDSNQNLNENFDLSHFGHKISMHLIKIIAVVILMCLKLQVCLKLQEEESHEKMLGTYLPCPDTMFTVSDIDTEASNQMRSFIFDFSFFGHRIFINLINIMIVIRSKWFKFQKQSHELKLDTKSTRMA